MIELGFRRLFIDTKNMGNVENKSNVDLLDLVMTYNYLFYFNCYNYHASYDNVFDEIYVCQQFVFQKKVSELNCIFYV